MYQRCINRFGAKVPFDPWGTPWRGRQPVSRRSASSATSGSCASTESTPATGKHRPRQLGTYPVPAIAQAAARALRAEESSTERGTVELVGAPIRRSSNRHHAEGAAAVRVGEPATSRRASARSRCRDLDRDDVADWIEPSPLAGKLSRRSVQICRTVLRAALERGRRRGPHPAQSPAARVGLPRTVAKPVKVKEAVAWTADEVDRFLAATADHRGRSRSGSVCSTGCDAARCWRSSGTTSTRRPSTLRIDESLVATNEGAAWGNAKNERSRRTIPIDDDTMTGFAKRRGRAGRRATRRRQPLGRQRPDHHDPDRRARVAALLRPSAGDRSSTRPSCRRLTSTACATRRRPTWSQAANDVGELRAIADLLGHSPEMLMNTYAHALPQSRSAVVDRIGQRGRATSGGSRKSSTRVVRLAKKPTNG